MAIVVRIISADGKRTVMKALPGLPARIKVPVGAKVDITEDGQTKSLAQYVNEHANVRKDGGQDQVNIETVQDWETGEAWLNSMAAAAQAEGFVESETGSPGWFTTADDESHDGPLGLDSTALLIGALGAAGVAYGLSELSGDNGLKDVTAPTAPTALDLATDDDTGSSTTDNITNKTSGLTISGKAEAGSTVELFDGTTSLGTVTAAADGTFSKDVSLAEGEHSITAVAKDKAGNASPASAVTKVTVDSTVPGSVTALDLAADDDTGVSSTDNITTKTSGLTLTGKGDAGATVELFDGTTSLGTVTVGTNGTFTKDISLSDGTHAITVKALDVAGNSGPASDVLTIKVDTSTIPASPTGLDLAADDDTGPSSTDNLTSKASGLTISGNAPQGTTVELFDGTTSLGTVSVGADGKFSKDVSLSGTGPHTITAKSTDAFGVSSAASDPLTITLAPAPAAPTGLDLAPEDDSGSSNTDNITNHTSGLTISGNAEAGSSVELFDGSTSLGKATAGSDGKWTLDVGLSEGVHTLTAKATNSAGYSGAASSALTVTVDTTAPNVPDNLGLVGVPDSSNSDITINTSNMTVRGTGEVGATIELREGNALLGTATVGSSGNFTGSIELPLGTHDVTARAIDVAGNVGNTSTALHITVVSSSSSSLAALDDLALHNSGGSFG